MKIKEGFILKQINGVNTVIAVGNATKLLNGMLIINDTGAFLWKALATGTVTSNQQLVSKLTEEYDLTSERAENDVSGFLDKLKELKIIDEN